MAKFNDDPNAGKLTQATKLMVKGLISDPSEQTKINAILFDQIMDLQKQMDRCFDRDSALDKRIDKLENK